MITFPDKATERAYMLDLIEYANSKAESVKGKKFFDKQDLEVYQTYSGLADAAREVVELENDRGQP